MHGRGQATEYLEKKINALTPEDIWLFGLYDYHPLLFLLGEKDRAIKAVHKYSPDLEHNPLVNSPEVHCLSLAYLRNPGPATADKMLQAAGRSKPRQCWAHWLIGCVQLGAGDRKGARLHFEACVATHCYSQLLIPHGCRAYVARMNRDPNWPPWIPVKKK